MNEQQNKATQQNIQFALSNWINGDKTKFKEIITAERENILKYNGRGNIWTYFLPALLIKDFWDDMQATGFPMEKIVQSNNNIIGWIYWDDASQYIAEKDPDHIKKMTKYGIYEEAQYPNEFTMDVHLETILDYYNTALRDLVSESINAYLGKSDDEWESSFQQLALRILPKPVQKLKP